MNWTCLEDHATLTRVPDDGSLRCPRCERRYPLVDDIPLFTRSIDPRAAVERAAPPLEELWRLMRTFSADEAATRLCQSCRCSRSLYSADWKFFFSIPPDGTTLELGAGFGDDSVDLAAGSGRTISVVPSLLNARVVRRHLHERTAADWPVAVMTDLDRLPLENGSVNAIALEDAAASGFGLTDHRLSLAAAEWRRVLAPDGVVFLGLANGLHRLPGMERLRARLRSRVHREPLNRLVKRWAAPGNQGRLGVAATVRTMTRQGFRPPLVYTPLPDENDARVVLPVHERHVVRYFLDNLVRKNAAAVRAAIRVAQGTVTLGLFPRLVPYYYLIFRVGSGS